MEEKRLLDISWNTIFRILFVVFSLYIVFSIGEIVIWVVFALIISVLFNPLIEILVKGKVPRILSAIFVYLLFFGLLGLVIYMITPLFIRETKSLFIALPEYFQALSPFLEMLGIRTFENIEELSSLAYESVEKMAGNIFSAFAVFFGGFFSAFFVLAVAFFFSLEKGLIEKSLVILFPKQYEEQILSIWKRSEKKVSGWFLARIVASIFVGIFSYITFLIFGLEYPLSLALLSGIFNFVPYIGPALMGVLLFLIILPVSFMKAVFVFIAFTLIQQIEGNVITPFLMKRIMGIPPSVVLIALVVGGRLWGLMGAILVIPLMAILFEFLKEFLKKRREEEYYE